MTPDRRTLLVKSHARQLGFDAAGITSLDPVPHADALTSWLNAGMAGTMTYLHRQAANRRNPARIVEGATRAIVLALNYYRPDPARGCPAGHGVVAKYARGGDYHRALEAPLAELARRVVAMGPEGTFARWFVDAGPVPERELAQRAGLGWIGKNTMLIAPRAGSFFFLASVLTNLQLAVDAPYDADRCGSCRRCLDVCPTDAFVEARILDSRRCIAYLTIEHRGEIPPALRAGLGHWVFGCDLCQDVCPWNRKFAAVAQDGLLAFDDALACLPLQALDQMSDEEFEGAYGHTPMERAGAAGMRRNARALAGRGDAEGVSAR